MEAPTIEHCFMATVKLGPACAGLTVTSNIMKLCMDWRQEVLLLTETEGGIRLAEGNSMLDLLGLGAVKGDRITVIVKGRTRVCHQLTLALCSLLESPDKFNLTTDLYGQRNDCLPKEKKCQD